jgi:medium-chain acyl-[acyl-carrier-protein] hydrolase
MELCAMQLPGRENRLRESPFTRMSDAVERVAEALEPHLDLPFALFGHSMGAILCFELARLLRRRYGVGPTHLFVSARRAPQFPDPRTPLRHLPDALFVAEINRRYNGLPREVLANAELMELLLPMLRADVQMIETYAYEPALPLDCPITALGGLGDSDLLVEDLEGWRAHTNSRFETRLFPGDHFFIQSVPKEVLGTISRCLNLASDFGSHRGFGNNPSSHSTGE